MITTQVGSEGRLIVGPQLCFIRSDENIVEVFERGVGVPCPGARFGIRGKVLTSTSISGICHIYCQGFVYLLLKGYG